jgi:putative membrane protein (TIGR04086 family)
MKDVKSEGLVKLLAPIKGALLAYIITAVVFIIYALLLTYTDISDKNKAMVVMVTTAVSIIAGGIKGAAAVGSRGWLWGIATGILYVAVMIAAGFFLIPGYMLGTRTLVCLMLAVGSGGLGGILGVNLGKK